MRMFKYKYYNINLSEFTKIKTFDEFKTEVNKITLDAEFCDLLK